MNLKSTVIFEHEINGKVFSFIVPVGSTYNEATEAAQAMQQGVIELLKANQEAIKSIQNPAQQETPDK